MTNNNEKKTIDFHYEFSSPYGYMAAELIDDMAAKYGYHVNWKPFLHGAVFKLEGTKSLTQYPMKGAYSKYDMARSANFYQLEFNWPKKFPIMAVNSARAVYWLKNSNNPEYHGKDNELSLAIYRAAFVDGKDISDLNILAQLATSAKIDADVMLAAIKTDAIKQILHDEVEKAIGRKVFGSPFFFIDNEPFWGMDRFPQMEKWLATGGW